MTAAQATSTIVEVRRGVDRTVHDHLRRHASPDGTLAVSHRDLAAALPISPATARRALARLITAGRIELVARGTGGRHRSRYRVHG